MNIRRVDIFLIACTHIFIYLYWQLMKTGLLNSKTVALLKKNKEVKAVLLFGSYLTDQKMAQDVDIAIVGDLDDETAISFFGILQSNFDKELDWIILNSRTNDILAFEIIKNHQVLYVSDMDYVANLFSLLLRKHEDESMFRSRYACLQKR